MVGHTSERGTREVEQQRAAQQRSTLEIGRATDPAEGEADHFADGLLRDLGSRPMPIHRATPVGSADRLGGTMADPSIAGRIRAAGGGRPLPEALRRTAEQRSGRDLSNVRVHRGAEADELNHSLDARAFATGSKIFLGRGGGGADVLAHEVGHVVQQGGGSIGRIHRSATAPTASLRPLQSAGSTRIRRLFGMGGKSKSKVDGVDTKSVSMDVAQNNAKLVAERTKLRRDIAGVEKALAKLQKGSKVKGTKAKVDSSQAADMAASIQAAAMRLQAGMSSEASQGKGSAKLGIFHEEAPRLKQIVATTQRILDDHTHDLHDNTMVKNSKVRAATKYLDAGRQAGAATAAGAAAAPAAAAAAPAVGAGQFKHLGAKGAFKPDADLSQAKDGSYEKRVLEARGAGAALGLSPAEIAAIGTFTRDDYHYINPATANSDSWMKTTFPKADDKELAEKKAEGSAHAAMAVQGLLKLPVYKGTTYRGTKLSLMDAEKKFPRMDKRSGRPDPITSKLYGEDDSFGLKIDMRNKAEKTFHRVGQRTFDYKSLASSSKELAKAVNFCNASGGEQINVLYEMHLTNGRDIEDLSIYGYSGGPSEREVALLPGATFEVVSVEYSVQFARFNVVCRQIR